jgi:hypothetical protein
LKFKENIEIIAALPGFLKGGSSQQILQRTADTRLPLSP